MNTKTEVHRTIPEIDVLKEVPPPRSGLDWMSKEELRTILNARTKYPVLWIKNPETKYMDVRIDSRSMHALITTENYNSVKHETIKKFWRLNPDWKDPNP